MQHQTSDRAVMLGTYILEHQATVRATAKQYGISKSTVHMDVIKENRFYLFFFTEQAMTTYPASFTAFRISISSRTDSEYTSAFLVS